MLWYASLIATGNASNVWCGAYRSFAVRRYDSAFFGRNDPPKQCFNDIYMYMLRLPTLSSDDRDTMDLSVSGRALG